MENLNKSAGILAMAGTAFLWSIAGLFIIVIDWNPFAIAGSRSLIASIVIFLYLKHPRIHLSFPQVAAAIANAATMLLFVSANKTTTAANAIFLQYLAPVPTVFIGANALIGGCIIILAVTAASTINARRREEGAGPRHAVNQDSAGLLQ